MNRKNKFHLQWFLRHPNISMLLLFILGVLLWQFDGFIQNIAFIICGIPIYWFLFTKTGDGRRIKKILIDPIIKPSGDELQYWDMNGKHKKSHSDAGNQSDILTKKGKLILEQKQSPIYALFFIIFMLLVLIFTLILIRDDGISNLYDTNAAMEQFLDGLIDTNFNQVLSTSKDLLRTIWVSFREFLVECLVLLAGLTIALIVIRLFDNRGKYRVEEEESEDAETNDSYFC